MTLEGMDPLPMIHLADVEHRPGGAGSENFLGILERFVDGYSPLLGRYAENLASIRVVTPG